MLSAREKTETEKTEKLKQRKAETEKKFAAKVHPLVEDSLGPCPSSGSKFTFFQNVPISQ
jgi:uncharacterized protein YaiL (DUF2058 family)